MRRRKIGNAEIALAMELITEGVRKNIIAYGLGVHPNTLLTELKKAELEGMIKDERYRRIEWFKVQGS